MKLVPLDLTAFRAHLISEGVYDATALEGDLFARNAVGDTLLHSAVYYNEPELVTELLHRGASIDSRGEFGFTALHCAADRGHAAIVRILLGAGANTEALSDFGETPLALARAARFPAIVQLFASGD